MEKFSISSNTKEIIKKELEEGKIGEGQKEEKLKELDEKVNIKALEKIKFELGSHKAGLVLFMKLVTRMILIGKWFTAVIDCIKLGIKKF